jgi:soluble lytic murein transglycosylase-like protein
MHLEADGVVGARTLSALVLDSKVAVRSRPPAVPSSLTYVVRPGDSLTAIAASYGVSLPSLARANHLVPSRVLLIGTRLKIPGAASSALQATPTEIRERLDQWSARLDVSPPLVRALAWMESGYQPNVVSQAGARGVLQTLPSTRDFVENVLLGRPAARNVDGDIEVGIVYLRHLLSQFAGDEHLALAAWYQGEAAVRRSGVFAVTKPFVENVLALKSRM